MQPDMRHTQRGTEVRGGESGRVITISTGTGPGTVYYYLVRTLTYQYSCTIVPVPEINDGFVNFALKPTFHSESLSTVRMAPNRWSKPVASKPTRDADMQERPSG